MASGYMDDDSVGLKNDGIDAAISVADFHKNRSNDNDDVDVSFCGGHNHCCHLMCFFHGKLYISWVLAPGRG